MKVLVTGSAGHLGEALIGVLDARGDVEVTGIDIKGSPGTSVVGSISDAELVARLMRGVDCVYHTATLHKPHVATHSKQDFIDTNVTGTLTLLEAAHAAGVKRFVFTSTTSLFGDALRPAPGEPAAWVTEETVPIPKNIYGVTKSAAEDLCHLFHRRHGIDCVILRTSRFFPEADDDRERRALLADDNLKTVEFLYRRVSIEDVVEAHLVASERCSTIGFGRYIISATTPFLREDAALLGRDAKAVLARRVPQYLDVFDRIGWDMLPRIDRVYDNAAARRDLGWEPVDDFARVTARVDSGAPWFGPLANAVGLKGYHEQVFEDGPYPVDS